MGQKINFLDFLKNTLSLFQASRKIKHLKNVYSLLKIFLFQKQKLSFYAVKHV